MFLLLFLACLLVTPWSVPAFTIGTIGANRGVVRIQEGRHLMSRMGVGDGGGGPVNEEVGLRDVLQAIQAVDAKVADQISAVDAKITSLDAKVSHQISAMDAKITSLDAKVSDQISAVRKDVAAIQSQLGLVAEGRARDLASSLLGEGYARSLVARSIQDLMLCFPEGEERLREPLEWARK